MLTSLCLSIVSQAQNSYTYSVPEKLDDGWSTANWLDYAQDTSRLYHLFSQLHSGGNKLHSVLVVKNDQLILEEYLNGQTADEPHDLRSATKSIRALLMGIAIDQGFVESVDDPIEKYLSQRPQKNLDSRKSEITIRHLLTMSPGWDCNDWNKKSKGQEDKVYRKSDWIQHTLDLPMINDPGTVSNYCSMGAILVAEIISQSSSMSIDAFAKKYLFDPMNITNYNWGHTSNKEVIPSGKRLYMTSRDFAKIGLLTLNQGKWNGQQLVSSDWIREMTTTKTQISGMDYGYFWWSIPLEADDQTYIAQTATGNGGQYLMLFPELDLVLVFTGGAYNSQEDKLPFMIASKVILPALGD